MRCETCGEYIYKGKKFNARKETVEGESYYSIKIFRFYIKCPRCSTEITFKTDPKNTDYIAEHGASRNFEPWREERIAGEEKQLQKELEEENNPMKALENRTLDSKREMDILDALDEIRTRNARNERVDADSLLEKLVDEDLEQEKTVEELLEEEDERLAKALFHDTDGLSVRRTLEDEEPQLDELLSEEAKQIALPDFSSTFSKKRKMSSSDLGIIIRKKPSSVASVPLTITKSTQKAIQAKAKQTTSSTASPTPLASLIGDYGSDSQSDG